MRKRKKIIPMKYPIGTEWAYRQDLLKMNKVMRKLLDKHLVSIVPNLVEEPTDIHALPTGVVRQDAWQDELRDALNKIAKDMVDPVNATIKRMPTHGARVNQFNKDEWRRLIRSQYGVNPTAESPAEYKLVLDNWAYDNAALIRDIPAKTLTQIRDATVDALMSGKAPEDMTDEIYDIMDERMDVTDSRARLIARDQVAKLNGQLTKERQIDAGVDSYIWRTVGDERVRETHDAVDGQTFTWDSPPGETDFNHPGEDYQCRCTAEPILPETLEFEANLLEDVEA